MTSEVIPVFCNEKNMANYAYIVKTPNDNSCIIIDAAETVPILNRLNELNLIPSHILTTHHHFDHVGANLALKEKYNLKIVAPEKEFHLVPGADIKATPATNLQIKSFNFEIIAAPGHTAGHVLYHLKQDNRLFTGDVLFNLCIGGLFEGTPEEMFETLQKIKALCDNTEIFPGHEYTRSCLPHSPEMTPQFSCYLQKMRQREKGQTAPALLSEEKMFNPYLKAGTLSQFLGQ